MRGLLLKIAKSAGSKIRALKNHFFQGRLEMVGPLGADRISNNGGRLIE